MCKDSFRLSYQLNIVYVTTMLFPTNIALVTFFHPSPFIIKGDILVFKPNSVHPARQMFYQSLPSEEFSIDPPHNPQELSFSIDGPKRINRCGTYQLKAEQIAGHGGRPVTYRWQPYQLPEGGAIQDLELFNTQNGQYRIKMLCI